MTPDELYIHSESLGMDGLGPGDEPSPEQDKAARVRVERFRAEISKQQEKERSE